MQIILPPLQESLECKFRAFSFDAGDRLACEPEENENRPGKRSEPKAFLLSPPLKDHANNPSPATRKPGM